MLLVTTGFYQICELDGGVSMKKNVGAIDRVLRVAVGIILIALALTGTQPIGAFGWLGIIPLLTAFISFCPLYTLLHINTCGDKKSCGAS